MSNIQYVTQMIRVQPICDAEPLMCNVNVDTRIKAAGGRAAFGWKVQHDYVNDGLSNHCVWESPEGELVDVTPDYAGMEGDYAVIEWPTETEFVRDDAAVFTGRSLPTRYVPTRPGNAIAKACEFMTIADECLRRDDLERCRYWTNRANRAGKKAGVLWPTPDSTDLRDVLKTRLA